LEEKIKDKGFIVLIKDMLKAGVLSEWKYHNTYSGVPQGGTASPMLANVYGHELDQFMKKLINQFNVGKRRPANLEYQRLANRKHRIRKTIDQSGKTSELIKELRELSRRMKEIPSKRTHGDDYKRLRYCRYADDVILGIIGTKEDAKDINEKVVHFLAEKLGLKISPEKSGIFAAKKGIKFLNYHIHTNKGDRTLRMKINGRYTTKRTITEHISLHVPQQRIIDFCAKNEYGDWYKNEPKDKPKLLNASDVEILYTYNAELSGLANYYCLADDVKRKLSKLFYLAEYSLVKTLANKHKAKQTTIHQRLKKGNELILKYDVNGREKEITLFKLKHMTKKPKSWDVDQIANTLYLRGSDSELVRRMSANECEYCGRTDLPIQIHHVGKLKDIRSNKHLEKWQKVMVARNRKTIFLCSGTKDSCHYLLHRGKLPDKRFNHPWTCTKWT
jgi:RNA-directed DNA polymerase